MGIEHNRRPTPLEDQLYFDPLIEEDNGIPKRVTEAGVAFFFFPWYFFILRKIKYTVLDLILAQVALSCSILAMLAGLSHKKLNSLEIAVIFYFVFHTHCLSFLSGLYRSGLKHMELNGKRIAYIFQFNLFPWSLWITLGGSWAGWF